MKKLEDGDWCIGCPYYLEAGVMCIDCPYEDERE